MRLAFTGTRHGISIAQTNALRDLLTTLSGITHAYHGGCVGADEEFHDMVRVHHPTAKITVWPGHIPSLRASMCRMPEQNVVLQEPMDALTRNRRFVEECETLIGCPGGMKEEVRSGTWATIRHGRKLGRRIFVVWPDGTIDKEPERKAT